MERCPITITLPDGKQIDGTAWETTPLAIAASLSKSLAERTVIAKVLILIRDQKITLLQVDGVLFDLTRPLEKSCNLQLLDFETDDGKKVIFHMIFSKSRSFGILLLMSSVRLVKGIMVVIYVLVLPLKMDSIMKWQWRGLYYSA